MGRRVGRAKGGRLQVDRRRVNGLVRTWLITVWKGNVCFKSVKRKVIRIG